MKNEGGKKNLIKVTEIRATVVGATGATFKGNKWQQVRQVAADAIGETFKGNGWLQVQQEQRSRATGGSRCDRW